MSLLVLFAVLAVVPAGFYFSHGGGGSRVWGLVAAGQVERGRGTYRGTRETLWKRGSAPLVVRVAALSSFFLGQMIVPGGLCAFGGVVVMIEALSHGSVLPVFIVVQASAPTGLAVAAYLLAAGGAMLHRDDDAVAKARRAWRWAVGHNVALLTGLAGAVALSWTGLVSSRDEAAFAVMPALYACFSIGQALLVRRAAATLEAYAARQREEPAPLEPTVLDGAS